MSRRKRPRSVAELQKTGSILRAWIGPGLPSDYNPGKPLGPSNNPGGMIVQISDGSWMHESEHQLEFTRAVHAEQTERQRRQRVKAGKQTGKSKVPRDARIREAFKKMTDSGTTEAEAKKQLATREHMEVPRIRQILGPKGKRQKKATLSSGKRK